MGVATEREIKRANKQMNSKRLHKRDMRFNSSYEQINDGFVPLSIKAQPKRSVSYR